MSVRQASTDLDPDFGKKNHPTDIHVYNLSNFHYFIAFPVMILP